MKNILQFFGFTLRDLAEVLGISHSQLIAIEKGDRKASGALLENLSHPLFASIDFEFNPLTDSNPDDPAWIEAELLVTKGKLQKAQKQLDDFKKQSIYMKRIAHHTQNLEESRATRKNLISNWWLWQGEKAQLWLDSQPKTKQIELERRIFLLEAEVQFLLGRL